MRHSQSSLSKKGHLGTIFLAAYFFKKLKKEQILRTDITSSVGSLCISDKIILDADISYRVLSQLLLGIVRIFLKKVEILYHDSTDAMDRICKFITPRVKRMRPKEIIAPRSSRKQRRVSHGEEEEEESRQINNTPVEAMVAPYHHRVTITIPKNLTLDSFMFDMPEEGDEEGDTINDHCLIDEVEEEYDWQLSSGMLQQYQNTEDPIFGFNSACFTPVRDVLSGEMMNDDIIDLQMDDIFTSGLEPLKDVQNHHESRTLNVKQSLIVRLDAVEHEESQYVVQPINLPQGDWNLVDFGLSVSEVKFSKATPDRTCDDPDDTHRQVESIEFPKVSSESLESGVKTPAIKEGKKIRMFSRKRKCVFDEATVLSNNAMIEAINDSSSIVLKRSKAIHTSLDVWRAVKFCDLHKAFTEPLIPYPYPEFKDHSMKKSSGIKDDLKREILAENIRSVDDDDVRAVDIHDNYLEQEDRVEQQDTTVLFLEHERRSSTSMESDLEETAKTSTCLPEKEEEELGNQGGFSIRTRSVAQYLCKAFKYQNKRGDQSDTVNLISVLNGKIRRSSANVFYETLILKTQGCIDVRQEAPYSEIIVSPNPKLYSICNQ